MRRTRLIRVFSSSATFYIFPDGSLRVPLLARLPEPSVGW
jgi:hypothetical protein